MKAHYKNPSADYGIRLRPSAVQSSLNRVCYISSDYYADTSLRPIITIYYLKFVGIKGVRNAPSSSILNPTYNCQSYAFWLSPQNGVNVFPQLNQVDVEYCKNTTVANALERTKVRMEEWLDATFPNRWDEVDSYDAPLDFDEWMVCMRVGVNQGEKYDFHFWYRADDGDWYNKHGYYAASEKVSGNVINPSTANASDGWENNGAYFYTSDTVYYTIKT